MPYITSLRNQIYAFAVLDTFSYIATCFCEEALLLFPKSIVDDIEGNLRT